jgi:phosphonate transport system substrate-binding protein
LTVGLLRFYLNINANKGLFPMSSLSFIKAKTFFAAAVAVTFICSAHLSADMPKKITVAFQPQESVTELTPNAEKMAAHLSEALGVEVKVYVPTSYVAVVEAMRGGHADVAYFSARPFTIAQSLADAEAVVAEVRRGKTYYYSQWYVKADSDYDGLEDLENEKAAFTSPTSTSGYLFPYAKLIQEQLLVPGEDPNKFFDSYIFAGGYQQSLMALVNGQVDAAAASDYALGRYLTEEQQKEIRVLSKQGPVPSHLMAVRKSLPKELKDKLRGALLELNEPEHKELLSDVYGAEGFEAVTDAHVNALKQALELTGIEPVPGEDFGKIGGPEPAKEGAKPAASQPTSAPSKP